MEKKSWVDRQMNHIAISTELWVNEEEKIASFHDTEQWKYLVFPDAEQMIHYLDYLIMQGYRFQ